MTSVTENYAALDGCLTAITRCADIVASMTDEQYAESMADQATIGQHIRHCVEHFSTFLEGVESGTIDYDTRERDAALEVNRQNAITALNELLDRLRAMSSERLDTPLRLRQIASSGAQCVEVNTSVARELLFLSGHAVHHIAICVMLAERSGTRIPSEAALAYSTEAYRAAQGD